MSKRNHVAPGCKAEGGFSTGRVSVQGTACAPCPAARPAGAGRRGASLRPEATRAASARPGGLRLPGAGQPHLGRPWLGCRGPLSRDIHLDSRAGLSRASNTGRSRRFSRTGGAAWARPVAAPVPGTQHESLPSPPAWWPGLPHARRNQAHSGTAAGPSFRCPPDSATRTEWHAPRAGCGPRHAPCARRPAPDRRGEQAPDAEQALPRMSRSASRRAVPGPRAANPARCAAALD